MANSLKSRKQRLFALKFYSTLLFLLVVIGLPGNIQIHAAEKSKKLSVTKIDNQTYIKTARIKQGMLVSKITLHFRQKYSALRFHPKREGVKIILRMQTEKATQTYKKIESLFYKPNPAIPLFAIHLRHTSPNEKTLEIQFKNQLKFKIVPSQDSLSLIILLNRNNKSISRTDFERNINSNTALLRLKKPFAINLKSSNEMLSTERLKLKKLSDDLYVYPIEVKYTNLTLNQLRIGHFASKDAAYDQLKEVRKYYPAAHVEQVSLLEVAIAQKWYLTQKITSSLKYYKKNISADRYTLRSLMNLAVLMEKASFAMNQSKYLRAINLYEKLLRYRKNEYTKLAHENLAIARHKNKQYAYARFEYSSYLNAYPHGQDAQRVRQRLNTLFGLEETPKISFATNAPLFVPKPTEGIIKPETKPVPESDSFALAEVQNRLARYDSATNSSDFERSNKASFIQRLYSEDIPTQMANIAEPFSVDKSRSVNYRYGYRYNLFSKRRSDDWRISSLYYQADIGKKNTIRFGRQYLSKGGLIGRLDGISSEFKFGSRFSVMAFGGYPTMLSEQNDVQTKNRFIAVSAGLHKKNSPFTFNLFVNSQEFNIAQELDKTAIREEVGFEAQYYKSGRQLYFMVSHDNNYDDQNTLLFRLSKKFKNRVFAGVVFDYRKGPLLTAANAFYGQPSVTANEIREILGDEEIRRLANDNNARYASLTLRGSVPLSSHYTMVADLVATNIDSVDVVNGVSKTTAIDNEYYWTLSLIAKDIFRRGDKNTLALRHSDTIDYRRLSLTLNSVIPISHKWYINPRLLYLRQDNFNSFGKVNRIQPMLRLSYYVNKDTRIEFDGSYRYVTYDTSTASRYEDELYFNLRLRTRRNWFNR